MKKTKLFFVGAAILIGGGTAVHAQSWRNDGAVSLDKQYADYPCVNLLDSTSVTVEPTGQGSFAVCRAVRVQTTAGALQQRILKYDYDPLTAAATFKRVTIYHADGTYTSVDVSKACDYAAPARAIYWGARQIMLELGALQPGDIIDYEIDKKGFTYALLSDAPQSGDDSRFIPPMRGQFYDIVPFWSADPTLRKVYRVSLPAEKEMQFQFYQGSCASSMRYEDGRKVYTFAKDAILPFRREPNMVDFYDAAPKLMMSTTADWKEKSRWFYGVNEDYGSFTAIPEAQKKVDELIRGKKTELEKVAVLTHWVADNIRYAGISMGKGEGFTLHNLKMNYTDRCGVCKDIAGTLIAFLRMAGFEAFPAMTMAGSRVETIPADHFNHCVAVVKLSDGTMMPLDPTWVPFCRELWSSAEQQQNYLPGTPEGTDLCLTPISDPENHYVRIKAQNTLDEKGTLKGDQGEMIFKPFVLNNLYTQVLSYLRIDTSLEKRTYGFKDGCSRLVEMEETLRLPARYEWQGKEKQDQMDGSGAGFTGYMGQNDNQLQVKTSLRLKKRVYEASDWESFRNAVNTAKGYGEYIVVKK